MKALVYGLAKTGTTSTAEILGKIYDKSWHSEDFLLHVWAPLADRYWSREENGGSPWAWRRLATPAAPAYKGHSIWPRDKYASDQMVLKGLGPAELPEALEKCNVDSMTFDGFETVFWSIYNASPEAKVIFLNWRDFGSYVRSGETHSVKKVASIMGFNFLNVGQHYLPWNAFAVPLLDSFVGTATDLMRNGNRVVDYDSFLVLMLRHSVTERRFLQHHQSGLRFDIHSESEYYHYWEYGKKMIPKERRVELDLSKHSPADLCRMLGVTDRPICKDTGKIPTVYPVMLMERKRWYLVLAALPWYAFMHWANYWLTWTVIYWVAGKLSAIVLGCAALLGLDPNSLNSKKSKKSKKS